MAKIKSRDLRVSLKNKEVLIESAYELFLRSRKSRCSQATIGIYTEKQKKIIEGFSGIGIQYMSQINPPSIRSVIADYQASHTCNGAWKLFTVIRTFLLWYWDEYELGVCPIHKVMGKDSLLHQWPAPPKAYRKEPSRCSGSILSCSPPKKVFLAGCNIGRY